MGMAIPTKLELLAEFPEGNDGCHKGSSNHYLILYPIN